MLLVSMLLSVLVMVFVSMMVLVSVFVMLLESMFVVVLVSGLFVFFDAFSVCVCDAVCPRVSDGISVGVHGM